MNNKELGVFIIWEKAREYEQEILSRIGQCFDILKIFEVHWDKDCFSSNLTSFYEMDLRNDCDNIYVRGTGAFLAIVVEDRSPFYSMQRTNRGIENVNTNMYVLKEKIRNEITHTYSFHASVSYDECKNNIVKLLGRNVDDFIKEYSLDGSVEKIERNCPGIGGWKSVEELFYVLNECMPYVLLRGFDNIPHKYRFKNDGDIDILVSDLPRFRNFLLPEEPGRWNAFKFFNYVDIDGEKVLIHPKFVGDFYYDRLWQEDILRTRVLEGGRYIPKDENYFWTLLYHGLFHKENYSKYKEILKYLGKEIGIEYKDDKPYLIRILTNYMVEKGYKVQLHLDNIAGHLCLGNIPKDIIEEKSTYYIFKSFYKDQIVGITVVSKKLIYVNPELFTDIVIEFNRWFYLEDNILDEQNELYFYVKNRETSNNEYMWRFSKRYDDLCLMSYFDNGEKHLFDKKLLSSHKSVGTDIVYYQEKSEYIDDGIKVIDHYASRYIRESTEGLINAIAEFLDNLYSEYGDSSISLAGEAWDLCSKNCFLSENRYMFFDTEAAYKGSIEKAYMAAVEVDLVKRAGIYRGDEQTLFTNLCTRLNLSPNKSYDEYISEKYTYVDKITLGELSFSLEVLFSAYNAPVKSDLIPKLTHEKLHEAIRVYDGNVQAELCDLRMKLLRMEKSHRLVEDMLEIEFLPISYDDFFKSHNIDSIVVYGLGKYGIRFLSSLKHKKTRIIGCIDKKVGSYRDYEVFRPWDEIPNNDAIVVALLDGEEIQKKYMDNGVRCILLRDMVNELLKKEGK